ncbi:hypothetical protein L8C07_05435 [Paenibacillus sp. CMAA1739]|uniref:hypothetical protein n=1 Tax=Paenibacillus ottowii TaxID=2315729 RepID=UPI002DC00180|nr:hypothetical protein [Paenibacillus sp. CMAA1739]MEC4565380.1 hypothetical protein [Paenibacillus sp. CMAA1739]
MLKTDGGLTTIKSVRNDYREAYNGCSWLTKVVLKCWLSHSESRNKNNNYPFSFENYTNHLSVRDYIEQIELDMIDCEDIGGKDTILAKLKERLIR